MIGTSSMHVYLKSTGEYLGRYIQVQQGYGGPPDAGKTFVLFLGTVLSATPAGDIGAIEVLLAEIKRGFYEADCSTCYFYRPFIADESLDDETGQCMVDPPKSPGSHLRPQTREGEYCDKWIEQAEELQEPST
jgi:hypothetical protein